MLEYPIHGAKGGEEKPHTPYEQPNNLLSTAYAKVLIAVAEGELAGNPTARDIYLNGTPLMNADGTYNFGGVKWEWRSGTQHQDYIKGLPEVSTEINVGIEVTNQFAWTQQINEPGLDAVRVTLAWQALLEQKENGDTVGSTVQFAVDVSANGGPFVEMNKWTVTGKTNTTYEKTVRVDLPESTSGWTVRVRRITPDSTNSRVQNKFSLKSYTTVMDIKQTYPHTALLYVEFDARTFGGGSIPKVSVRTKGRIIQVPDNYDPVNRTYSGVWTGMFKWAWCNNPAWVYYDIVTQDRFGLGHKVTPDMVDKWGLYEVAQYCDIMVPKGDGSGDLEPRHTMNIYIQKQQDAWQALRDIATAFNGMTYWNGTTFTAIADKEEDLTDIALFSRSNVVNGRFDYKAADDKSIYTSALISYDEPTAGYETQVEATWERSQILRWGGDRQTTLSAIGCTSRGEAQRRGKYVLLTNMFNRQVSFRTGLQGLSAKVMPGSIIHVVDPLIGGRPYTGRIKVSAGRVLTLDRDPQAKAGDIMYVTKGSGVVEGRTVQSSSGNIVTVTTPFTEQPEPNTVWYLEAKDLKSQLFRVTKVTNPQDGVFEIEGVEYNESKYKAIDNGARLEPRPISKVPAGVQAAPAFVNITSRTYIEQTMAVTTMTVSWPQTEGATSYEVQWRTNDGDWVNVGVTGATEIDVKGIYAGQYMARVRARNPRNIASVWTTSMLTNLAGKEGAPPTIASLDITPMFFGMRLDWSFKPGSDDAMKTEIVYSQSPNFVDAIKLGDFAYPLDYAEMHGLKAGQRFWFWARITDRTGNVGEWFPASDMVGVEGHSLYNDDGQYNDYLAGLIGETALDKELYDRIELIDGPASLAGSVNQRLDAAVKALEDQLQDITDALVYDPEKTYVKGDVVRQGQKLYQAIGPVPLNSPPPNDLYWKDVGDILETADGLALRVELNEINIAELDGKMTSMVRDYEAIQAQAREDDGEGDLQSALNGFNNKAAIIEEREVRANEDEALAQRIITISAETAANAANITTVEKALATQTEALGQRIDRVQAETNTAIGELENTVNVTIAAQISQEVTARTNADEALGQRISSVEANYKAADTALGARITTEETARATADAAIASRIDTIEAGLITDTQVKALIQVETTARVNADGALGKRIDTVQATAGANTAAIQETKTAQALTDGKVNTAWTLKMEAQSNGQYVAAGIGLGIANGPAGLQSQFLVRADRFAVVSGLNGTTSAPFVVQGGQVFINDAMINKATINKLVVTSDLRSANYVAGQTGIRIDFVNSLVEINGARAGSGRMNISNNIITVYDTAGVMRVRMGVW